MKDKDDKFVTMGYRFQEFSSSIHNIIYEKCSLDVYKKVSSGIEIHVFDAYLYFEECVTAQL